MLYVVRCGLVRCGAVVYVYVYACICAFTSTILSLVRRSNTTHIIILGKISDICKLKLQKGFKKISFNPVFEISIFQLVLIKTVIAAFVG